MKWRPRFSLRTLLVLVTLAGCYFGTWEITKRVGVSSVVSELKGKFWIWEASSPMPFVVGISKPHLYDETAVGSAFKGNISGPINVDVTRHFYVWCFGWIWKTPIQWAGDGLNREIKAPDDATSGAGG